LVERFFMSEHNAEKDAKDDKNITSSQGSVSSNHPPKPAVNNRHRHRHRRHDESEDVKTSKALSWVLRHSALKLGMTIGPDGYVPVSQILSHPHKKLRGLTLESIQEVVSQNNKQRFSMIQKSQFVQSTSGQDGTVDHQQQQQQYGDWYIRANQGHSITTVDPYQLLTVVDPRDVPVIVHGTYLDRWNDGIRTIGLSKMTRTHIHFAKGMSDDRGVISGMRSSCEVFIFVNSTKCAEDQIEFFESANGVILTSGLHGILPPQYFSHVLTKSGAVLLDNR
jgi:2'-phosphotransferase